VCIGHPCCVSMDVCFVLFLFCTYTCMFLPSTLRSIAGVPLNSFGILRTSFVLRTTCMCSCCNWSASCVAACQTKNQNTIFGEGEKQIVLHNRTDWRGGIVNYCELGETTRESKCLMLIQQVLVQVIRNWVKQAETLHVVLQKKPVCVSFVGVSRKKIVANSSAPLVVFGCRYNQGCTSVGIGNSIVSVDERGRAKGGGFVAVGVDSRSWRRHGPNIITIVTIPSIRGRFSSRKQRVVDVSSYRRHCIGSCSCHGSRSKKPVNTICTNTARQQHWVLQCFHCLFPVPGLTNRRQSKKCKPAKRCYWDRRQPKIPNRSAPLYLHHTLTLSALHCLLGQCKRGRNYTEWQHHCRCQDEFLCNHQNEAPHWLNGAAQTWSLLVATLQTVTMTTQ